MPSVTAAQDEQVLYTTILLTVWISNSVALLVEDFTKYTTRVPGLLSPDSVQSDMGLGSNTD